MTLSSETETTNSEQKLIAPLPHRKIGGFLIFIVVVMILNLIRNSLYFLASLAVVTRKAQWEKFTNPESSNYHSYWKSVLILDVVSNAIIVILITITIIAFFRKRRTFPIIAIFTTIVIFLLAFIGHYFEGFIPAIAHTATYAKDGDNMMIRVLALGIWIPYYLLSKRVRETFVR